MAGAVPPDTRTVTVIFHGKPVEAAAGEVVLEFDPRRTPDQRIAILTSLGLRERLWLDHLHMGAFTIMTGQSIEEVIDAASRTAGIRGACPNPRPHVLSCNPVCRGPVTTCPGVGDILYPRQMLTLRWSDIDRAWNDPSIYGSRSNPAITIWVLDTGVDKRHPDLMEKFLYDPATDEAIGFPDTGFVDKGGHGTKVASVAAAATGNQGTYAGPIIQIYDVSMDYLPLMKVMPTPRRELAGGAVGSTLYAIGGRDPRHPALDTVEEYDLGASIWTTGEKMGRAT